MKHPVSYLFVPGNRPDRFGKALDSGADAVIIDLEDAVPADQKQSARDEVRNWLAARCPQGLTGVIDERVIVRINDISSPWFDADVDVLKMMPVTGIMLPKTESAEQVQQVTRAFNDAGHKRLSIIPIVESVLGVLNVYTIAAAPHVQRIAFGTHDYIADLDLSGDERGLLMPATQIALASRAAGIGTPIAGVTTEISSAEKIIADLSFARALGFGAKLCIHPSQVKILHAALVPTVEELEWARRVTAAASTGSGAVQIDGRMVDRPIILKAHAILERAKKSEPES